MSSVVEKQTATSRAMRLNKGGILLVTRPRVRQGSADAKIAQPPSHASRVSRSHLKVHAAYVEQPRSKSRYAQSATQRLWIIPGTNHDLGNRRPDEDAVSEARERSPANSRWSKNVTERIEEVLLWRPRRRSSNLPNVIEPPRVSLNLISPAILISSSQTPPSAMNAGAAMGEHERRYDKGCENSQLSGRVRSAFHRPHFRDDISPRSSPPHFHEVDLHTFLWFNGDTRITMSALPHPPAIPMLTYTNWPQTSRDPHNHHSTYTSHHLKENKPFPDTRKETYHIAFILRHLLPAEIVVIIIHHAGLHETSIQSSFTYLKPRQYAVEYGSFCLLCL
ncbi:uncharacterized protein MYCFIDRAFT_176438 [Pseudocercospora fijiensis CIRAD86]|uniref:Uncharacterized protein n=1 Tax=Pseudocercospora fijiensis (strain CIRAD86) TaxID=383855 RepID=M2ZPW8_PSEFD|nr:uncharacterized protein MYCFIDRAFT_176438 [Pseudocercospora fijiensis CIRAD86]EME81124.1 hypothetical protein MYCFIDRAFT_176438 [Pseudocercospora fijiensis CIRAD86]